MESSELYKLIKDSVTTGATTIRITTKLEPAAGEGAKIAPSTFLGEKNASTYATEERMIGEKLVKCVVLDSPQSQANRLEMALLDAIKNKRLEMPYVEVSGKGFDPITDLETPHRIADAMLRDSELGGKEFHKTDIGQELLMTTPKNSTALFETSPNSAIFGAWFSYAGDSTTKVTRVITSEMSGLDAVIGVSSSSRKDPLNLGASIPVYELASNPDEWTIDINLARKDNKSNPVLFRDGKLSNIGHSNIAPSLNRTTGGATVSEARQWTYISFPQLRSLSFPQKGKEKSTPERDIAARALLALIALYAPLLAMDYGYQLRSKCLLIPKEDPTIEWMGRTKKDEKVLDITPETVKGAIDLAVAEARKEGFNWKTSPMVLTPSDNLVKMNQLSKERSKAKKIDEDKSE